MNFTSDNTIEIVLKVHLKKISQFIPHKLKYIIIKVKSSTFIMMYLKVRDRSRVIKMIVSEIKKINILLCRR